MKPGLARDSAMPMYRQLKLQLRRQIESGELGPGSRVPSENELAAEHGVSRATARQALAELDAEGWLLRIVGKGTFVAERPRVDRVTTLTGFGENMRAIGRQPGYRVLNLSRIIPAQPDAQRLGLAAGEPTYRVVRLHLADDEPVAIADGLLPVDAFTRRSVQLTRELLERESLYAVLEDWVGVRLFRAIEEVDPGTANPSEAATLEVAPDEPLLRVVRAVYDPHDRPIELVRLAYVAARFRYRTELFRKPTAVSAVAAVADGTAAPARADALIGTGVTQVHK